MKIKVESAIELTPKQTESIQKQIQQAYGDKAIIGFEVDPNLIGGIRIVSPEKTLDLSLAARLSQLNQALQTSW